MADTVAGHGPAPRFVLKLVERLPDTSLSHAHMRGGPDHFGWGQDRYLLAEIYDALMVNTRVTGNWGKKKPPTIPPFPRPKSKATEKQKKKVSVKELFGQFSRR